MEPLPPVAVALVWTRQDLPISVAHPRFCCKAPFPNFTYAFRSQEWIKRAGDIISRFRQDFTHGFLVSIQSQSDPWWWGPEMLPKHCFFWSLMVREDFIENSSHRLLIKRLPNRHRRQCSATDVPRICLEIVYFQLKGNTYHSPLQRKSMLCFYLQIQLVWAGKFQNALKRHVWY